MCTSYPGRRVVRGSLPRTKEQRRDFKECPEQKYARLVGEQICNIVCRGITKRTDLETALAEANFHDLTVSIIDGEVHAFITKDKSVRRDKNHGHVIIVIAELYMRYCRGYGMSRGSWNCIPA